MTLFAADGALLRGWSRWWFWAWTSCCWLLLSLPLITAPAACQWLIVQQRRLAAGEAALGPGETLRFLLSRLPAALRLAGCHLAVAGLVLVGLLGPSPGGAYGWLVLTTSVVAGATWLLVAPWSAVMLERTGGRAVAALRIAYLLALSRIELALTSTATVVAATVAVPFLATKVPYLGPLLLVALPAATATIVTTLCDRAAKARDPHATGRIVSGSVPAA
ncbi:hypothetical protein ETD86_12010 [Nonomuraea turkmeniaca]|uniref:DUF624 domain-containing protein n=1 Tax=Nonomuraea turkmeniaca TaxID=103838 RepID=A0A5S4FQ23_9ACTN|nr:hypothetical protein [Nonomuraea turkmeniaca]TMR22281.1 hypothetical protein ETD86_12010 [Nonomuraea turkmeniaca]